MVNFLLFQGATRVKSVYASLANGTLVVFTPQSSLVRRCSHADVTLVSKEDDESLNKETTKWSNVQVRNFLTFGSCMLVLHSLSWKSSSRAAGKSIALKT